MVHPTYENLMGNTLIGPVPILINVRISHVGGYISGACPNDKTKVTRVRRLYDIANILQVAHRQYLEEIIHTHIYVLDQVQFLPPLPSLT